MKKTRRKTKHLHKARPQNELFTNLLRTYKDKEMWGKCGDRSPYRWTNDSFSKQNQTTILHQSQFRIGRKIARTQHLNTPTNDIPKNGEKKILENIQKYNHKCAKLFIQFRIKSISKIHSQISEINQNIMKTTQTCFKKCAFKITCFLELFHSCWGFNDVFVYVSFDFRESMLFILHCASWPKTMRDVFQHLPMKCT